MYDWNFEIINNLREEFLFVWNYNWLCHGATIRKVASSISDGVTEIFNLCNTSGSTVALV